MPFNLIEARWLPCRRASGARNFYAPHEITSEFETDPIVALDFPRPDWNAAVTELLIGLVSATMPPEDSGEWAAAWVTPPKPDVLSEALAPLTFAFNLDGEGPRAFQDFSSLENSEEKPVSALLIESPGEITTKENKDLFVKRAGVEALSLPYAAAALVTLQTYAPSGGQGNRTSMRGGGPLTFLITPRRKHPRGGKLTTLWDVVWSNIRNAEEDLPPLTQALSKDHRRWPRVFPWLADTRVSLNDQSTIPDEHADRLQAYFGMPRRIRLIVESGGRGECSLGGPDGFGTVRAYRAVNYGIMYSGWEHPLSPYYIDKKNGKLPFHPQPGLATYADWYAWWGLQDGVPAANLKTWPSRLGAIAGIVPDLDETRQRCVQTAGFDMDNMKARGFLDERIPYFEPTSDEPTWASNFQNSVRQLIDGAKETANSLKYALRINQFAKWDAEKRIFKLLDNAPKDAFEDVVAAHWAATQPAFVDALAKLHASDALDSDKMIRTDFHRVLRATALRLFDEATDIDTLADQNPRRLVEARRGLVIGLGANGKVAAAMSIAEAKPKGKGGGGKKK